MEVRAKSRDVVAASAAEAAVGGHREAGAGRRAGAPAAILACGAARTSNGCDWVGAERGEEDIALILVAIGDLQQEGIRMVALRGCGMRGVEGLQGLTRAVTAPDDGAIT